MVRAISVCTRSLRILPRHVSSRGLFMAHGRCRCERSEKRTEAELIAGRSSYTPDSFEEIVEDACGAVVRALEKAVLQTLEAIETVLEQPVHLGYKGRSDDFIDANVQLALTAARKLTRNGERCIRLLFPDAAEYDRSSKMFGYTIEADERLSMGYTGSDSLKLLQNLIGGGDGEDNELDQVDLFIVINHSACELPDMRNYIEKIAGDRAVILWNLELETLRADLGLFGFPSRDLHYEFLSRFKSVFFLRLRDYSKSIAAAPFLINYSGSLFREYPGPWQVLLKQSDGQYVCVAEDRVRYTLFEVKEELTKAMGLDTEEKGSTMRFLRRGYKRSTWWEEDLENEKSRNWRS